MWAVERSFAFGGFVPSIPLDIWDISQPVDLGTVKYFADRFDMRKLLQDYFQVAKECGRFQMAQFIARYFLNHETGQVEFQHEAFRNMQTMTEPSPMQFRSEAENSRRMNAVIHATKMLHELRRRERRDEGAQMPDFDEQEFERRFTARLTTVTARLAVGGDYPVNELFAGVSPSDYFEFLFKHEYAANDKFRMRMTFEVFKTCIKDQRQWGWVVDIAKHMPICSVCNPDGFPVSHPDGEQSILADGTEVTFVAGQAHLEGSFGLSVLHDAHGNRISSRKLRKVLRVEDGSRDSKYDTVSLSVFRAGSGGPDSAKKITEKLMLASEGFRRAAGFRRSARSACARARRLEQTDIVQYLELQGLCH